MRMRRWLAMAVLGAAISGPAMSVPALAQHSSGGHGGGGFSGGGHSSGGFSGAPAHSSGGFSGGSFGSPSGHSFAPSHSTVPRAIPRYGTAAAVHTGVGAHPGYGRPGAANSASHSTMNSHYGAAGLHGNSGRPGSPGNRPGGGGNGRNNGRNNWNRSSRGIGLYAYSPGWWLGPWQFYPWLDADLSWDFWHDSGDQDDAIAMASTGADMVEDAPSQGGGGDDSDAGGEGDDPPLHGSAVQLESSAPALTLVYRSGQTEQVANYVVSSSGVTVIDAGGVRSVPIGDLDVAGTVHANAQSGMQLPSSWQ
jgi:hypothetical protein